MVGDNPVDLLWHSFIEASEARLEVAKTQVMLRRDQSPRARN
jgi:hypothetical protein